MEKEAEKERGDEIKKFQKNYFANPKPRQNEKQRRHGLGNGEREKSAPIRETGRVPITGKVIAFVFVFFPFGFKSRN